MCVCERVLRCVINRIIIENAASVAGAAEPKRERTLLLPNLLPLFFVPLSANVRERATRERERA